MAVVLSACAVDTLAGPGECTAPASEATVTETIQPDSRRNPLQPLPPLCPDRTAEAADPGATQPPRPVVP